MSAPIRLPRSDGSGWRALRWVGRVLSLLALWPFWYAFAGKTQFDMEAMLFGGPGLALGIVLWIVAGRRLRDPPEVFEVDRAAGVARLLSGPVALASCPIAELGAWRVRHWQTRRTNKHGLVITDWYGTRCPGLGEHDVYVDTEAAPCEAWIKRADAATASVEGWRYSEAVVQRIMERYALRDREALLRSAAQFDDGNQYLREDELVAGARALSETTLGDRLAAALDRGLSRLSGSPAIIGLALLSAGLMVALYGVLEPTDRSADPSAAVLVAFAAGGLTLGWRAVGWPSIAIGYALTLGVALMAKPFFAPIISEFDGERYALSATSETHLYYVLSGLGLLLLAGGLTMALRVRR